MQKLKRNNKTPLTYSRAIAFFSRLCLTYTLSFILLPFLRVELLLRVRGVLLLVVLLMLLSGEVRVRTNVMRGRLLLLVLVLVVLRGRSWGCRRGVRGPAGRGR